MSVDALLAAGQQAAERLMADTCVIREITGSTTDPNTGAETPVYADPNPHEGKCRFKMTTTLNVNPGTDRDAGEQEVTISRILLQLPFAVTGIKKGMLVEVTASLDADMVGRTFRVDGPFGQTHSTMRRYLVEEVS